MGRTTKSGGGGLRATREQEKNFNLKKIRYEDDH